VGVCGCCEGICVRERECVGMCACALESVCLSVCV